MTIQLSHLIYRLSAVASSEPVEVWSFFSLFFSFFLQVTGGHFVICPFCKNPATGNILVLSWTGIHEQKEVPVFFILSLPLVAVYIFHLVVFLVLSARTYWVETLASVCLCAVHVAVPKPGCASSSHPCAQMMCTPMTMLLSSRGRNSKLVLSFCRINTCLKSVKKNIFFKNIIIQITSEGTSLFFSSLSIGWHWNITVQ